MMAQWSAAQSRGIIYRAVARGKLVLETPAHFGAGEQDSTQLVILRDALTGLPLLPGASQAGAFRHYLLQRERGYRVKDDRKELTYATALFGDALSNDPNATVQSSRLIVHDALGTESALSLRDGVKIDGQTRTADDGMLFNVQTWPEGTAFELCLELYICEVDNKADLQQSFAVILDALTRGEIPMGARKHRGYGRCRVAEWQLDEYDLTRFNDLMAWIRDEDNPADANSLLNLAYDFVDKRDWVRLEATFALQDSLMIRAGADVVDTTHLCDHNGQPILSGTSVAGALRARALKIANTIDDRGAVQLVDDMFGEHGGDDDLSDELPDDQPPARPTASRLLVEEHRILNPDQQELIQNRVKIDRFTGGSFETALMSEQPVFATPETQVTIKLELRYPMDAEGRAWAEQETGLLLLLLKDLWLEDLPLGGESSIGRGRLRGLNALLEIKRGEQITLYPFNAKGLEQPEQAATLQRYVEKLWGDA